MSDFVSGLRREVLEGHRRHEQRGRLNRAVRPVHPRSWRPLAIVAAVAVAAGVIAIAAATRHLIHPAPERPHIVGVIRIGGTPTGAAFTHGSLWVGDFRGSLVRIDPRRGRVLSRFRVGGQPQEIVAGVGSLWVRSPNASGPPGGPLASHLTRIDPITRKMSPAIPVGGEAALAAGPDAVWAARRFTDPEGIERVDPSRNAVVGRVAVSEVSGLAAAGTTLWAIRQDGTLVEIDAADGTVVHKWTRLDPGSPLASAEPAIVADADGVWMLSTGKSALIRVQAGEVVRRIPVDPAAQLLTSTPDGLWLATSDPLLSHNRLIRIDPTTGKPTGEVELGHRQPIAIVAAGATMCVVSSDGTVVLVR
jgi:outer membrane protein assembly factor BamB